MWFSPGMRLHDRFTLVEQIGAGGMSQVWRATDGLLGRPVAVKVLAARAAADPRLRDATRQEARAVARLTHPNLTQVYDYGEVRLPDGGPAGFLVMELVEGQTLADRLASGPLPWPEAVAVGRQVAAALAAAHRLGVVHRDIKPGNVMLTGEAGPGSMTVKVLDFGIAAVAGADTDPGRLLGTPAYLAPERRAAPGPAQPASDIYSLGVLLHEALVGRPAARPGQVPLVPGLPGEVAGTCGACLAADPAQRPGARQVAAALAAASGERDQPASTAPAGGLTVPAGGLTVPVGGPGAPTVPVAGAARHPPTRIDDFPPAAGPDPHRRARRRALAVAAAGLLLATLGVALLVAALRYGELGPAAQPGASPGQAPATPQAAPESPEANPEPTQAPAFDALAAEVVDALDAEIRAAFNQGAITRDAYDDLRDELSELRKALAEDKPDKRERELRKAAEEMREEVEDLLADEEILDPDTAEQLIGLLDQLLTA